MHIARLLVWEHGYSAFVHAQRKFPPVYITTHFTDMCIPHFFLASERRSTQAWLQKLAPFQVFINTSVIQDKTLTICIDLY
jgi:hypothetical protein